MVGDSSKTKESDEAGGGAARRRAKESSRRCGARGSGKLHRDAKSWPCGSREKVIRRGREGREAGYRRSERRGCEGQEGRGLRARPSILYPSKAQPRRGIVSPH